VHVVIELRAIDPKKKSILSQGRHISNVEDLRNALRQVKGIRVTVQDFAKLKFPEQVALSHSAGVFVSMHGAGTTHIFHSALGAPNCCALVELQPDHSLNFQSAQGYANLARLLGMSYYRYEASDGRTGPKGTEIDVERVTSLIKLAVNDVRTQRTCLNDVKDTARSADSLPRLK
jgi:Glycosyltransferase 61